MESNHADIVARMMIMNGLAAQGHYQYLLNYYEHRGVVMPITNKKHIIRDPKIGTYSIEWNEKDKSYLFSPQQETPCKPKKN